MNSGKACSWALVLLLLVSGCRAQESEDAMNGKIMESTLAGSWYESNSARLRSELENMLADADVPENSDIFAVVAPHAGYAYSGYCAAGAIQALTASPKVRRVIVLGFTHHISMPDQVSVPAAETVYRSPIGDTPLDTKAIQTLLRNPRFCDVPATRKGENSVEMMLPLLQVAMGDRKWSLVPVTLGQLSGPVRDEVAKALQALMDGQTVLVVSSDFTHFGPNFGYIPFDTDIPENLSRLDHGAIQYILAGDAEGFEAYCRKTGMTLCGRDSIGVLLRMLPKNFIGGELLYDTSGNRTGDFENSVSYAALAFYRGGDREPAAPEDSEVLTASDKAALLKLARASIAGAFEGKGELEISPMESEWSDNMRQVMGAFVTLTIDGDLRGCIGEIFPRRPLAEAVREQARNAAFEDPRFPSLSQAELDRIRIEISALTPPEPVASWKDIEIGRHGMVLSLHGRSAVFLPQVAPEQGWDLPTTLSYLSRKAGLSSDAWKDPEAKFTVFEAIVFHE